MITRWTSRFGIVSSAVLALTVLVWAQSKAQPPGAGELQTVRGTVKEFTKAPLGEIDGLILSDGTVVHWPPHLQDRFTDILSKGDSVRATGRMETGPEGDTHLEVSTLTNVGTGKTMANDDGPPPKIGPKAKAKAGPRLGDFQTLRGTVRDVTTAPKGEVDGFMLSDGTWVHWPPHLERRFTAVAGKGDRVRVVGQMETGPAGDTKLEVSILTNLTTNETAENPDRPAPAASRAGTDKAGDLEDRVRALEDKLDQLTRQIEQLRRRK